MVEHPAENRGVGGSIPPWATKTTLEKALLVRFSSLGDVALTSVLFDPLLEADIKPVLLTFKPYDQIFADDPRVEVVAVDKNEYPSRRVISLLRKGNFSLKVDLHKNLRSFLLKIFLPGSWKSYPKESIRRRLSLRFPRFRKPYSVTEAYLKALGIVGIGAPPLPRVSISEERLKRWQEKLPSQFVCLAPGARYFKKIYPYFWEVADYLRDKGFEVVWVGSREERSLAKGGINLCGEINLTDTLAVIKLAKVFVGNDSGLLHCARAVGTKAIQIYGGTHPTLGFSLYPSEGVVLCKDLPCQPCDLHGKGRCKRGDFLCLEWDPKEIVSHVEKLI